MFACLKAGGLGQFSLHVASCLLYIAVVKLLVILIAPVCISVPNFQRLSHFAVASSLKGIIVRMPSRTSSNASGDPRRSKSFSSTRPQQLKHAKSFNTSELAHHEALTAAELAFRRARERHTADAGYEYGSPAYTMRPALRSEGLQLERQQSVRFTGSNATKTRDLPHTRREVSEHQEGPDQENKNLRPEYIETIISSEPSSYRKLRKAKSLFAPGKPPSVVSTDGTQTSRAHFKHDSMRFSDSHNSLPILPDRRLRRSFSFLRGVTDRLSTANRQHAVNDAAIQIARDQYLRQLEEQRIKEQTSFVNLAKRRNSPKGLRRTVRTSSTNSYGMAIKPLLPFAEPPKVDNMFRKARHVSQTLKRALKKVFSRPLPDEPKLPEQHLSATKAHYRGRFDDYNGEHHFSPIPSPDVELLRRVDSCESIIRTMTGFNESEAPAESILSVTIGDETSNHQSRVTSWTNSTAANTINMPQLIERKRLSIIKEDGGPHQPSSSAGRYMDPIDGYAVFRQPVRLDNAGPVAARRVYSALQREIRKSEQTVALDDSDIGSDSSSEQLNSLPSHHGTLRTNSSGRKGMDDQLATDPQAQGIPVSRSVLLNPTPTVNVDGTFLRPDHGRYGLPNYEHGHIEPMDRLTPQQIAHFNEPDIPAPKKPLREVKSAFFPSESRIKRNTTSPYRRVMHDSSRHTNQMQDEDCCKKPNIWVSSPRLMAPIRNKSAAISESVYSRTEGGHSPRAPGSSMSLPKSDSSGEPGSAVIITSGLQSSERTLPTSSQRPYVSENSSGEWKKWMASEVSFFEDHRPEHDRIYNALPVKESGHKRENAQWDGEDVSIGKSSKPISLSKQPLGMLLTKANTRLSLQRRMSGSNIERFPFQNVNPTEKQESSPQKENTPKTCAQKRLDKQPIAESENKFSTPAGTTRGGPRPKNQQLTLSPRSEKKNSPASTNSRSSPERAELLRRLQNRSLQSLNKTSSSPKMSLNGDETEIAQTPPTDSLYKPDRAEQSFPNPSSKAAGSKALVGGFLKSRRSPMRISDESGGDPVFL